jgi:U3 small nucleolar RNA-associated protein 21
VGVFVWANRSLYEAIPLRNVMNEKIRSLALVVTEDPNANDTPDDETMSESSEEESMIIVEESPQEIRADDLITLSTLAKSKWQNLLSLEAIKVILSREFLNDA